MKGQVITKDGILAAIDGAKKIVLTVHMHPDGDALGSMLALYEYLLGRGKDVTMVVDDTIPQKFLVLPHVDAIRLPKDMTHWEEVDLLIVLDASTLERIGRLGTLCDCPIINIDHHISNTKYADFLYLEPKSAATGEILVDLLRHWGATISPTMADALYMAIATDCGFFRYGSVSPNTLEAASHCVAAGARPHYVGDIVEVCSQDRLLAIQKALQTVAFHDGGRVATLIVNHEVMKMIHEDTDGFVDFIRNVKGVEVAILIKEYGPKHIRVSFRSRAVDVNQIAACFGGGGHIRAAGCTFKGTLEEAVSALVSTVVERLPKEG